MALVLELLRRHRLFEGLSDEDMRNLVSLASEVNCSRRTALFEQGDPCDGFYIILSGMVRLFKVSPDGREHVVEVIRTGQSFAEAAVFAGTPYPVCAETLERSRFLFFPKDAFLRYLEERPRFLFGMIASLSVRMHQLVVKMERLTLRDARQRVAGFFCDLLEQSPSHNTLDVSRRTLASQLNLSPETLSRTLSTLQMEGLIAMEGRHFRVTDPVALGGVSQGDIPH